MRGVPSLMTPRMTSSLPPAVSLDSAGPKVRALICGGRWHTPQDWAKTRRPVVCVSLRVSSVAACCAGAASGHAESASTRAAALRVIFESSLDCTFSNFLKSMPERRRAEGANLEPGGVTGMRRAQLTHAPSLPPPPRTAGQSHVGLRTTFQSSCGPWVPDLRSLRSLVRDTKPRVPGERSETRDPAQKVLFDRADRVCGSC